MADCEYCHRLGHVWFQCPKKPDGWKPERLAKNGRLGKKALVGDVPRVNERPETGGKLVKVHASPVDQPKPKRKDTRKGDRHKPGYYRDYMRLYRQGLVGKKYRAKLREMKK